MKEILLSEPVERFFIVWGILHALFILIEAIRYATYKGNLCFEFYLTNKLLFLTYIIFYFDLLGILGFICYVAIHFILEGTLL